MHTLTRRLPLIAAAALGLGLTIAPAPAQEEEAEKISKDDSSAQAVEKRLKALEEISADLVRQLKASEADRAGLEGRLAESQKAREILETRLKTLNAAQVALLKKLTAASAEAGNKLSSRVETETAARIALEKKLAASEAARRDLGNVVKSLHAEQLALLKNLSETLSETDKRLAGRLESETSARAALESKLAASEAARVSLENGVKKMHANHLELLKRLSEASSKGRQHLAARLESTAAAGTRDRQALAQSLGALEERLSGEVAARESNQKKIAGLQKKSKRITGRIKKAEASLEVRTQRNALVHDDLQRIKRELLYLDAEGEETAASGGERRPFRDHYPFLGIVHDYVNDGKGLRIRRIAFRSPAHDSDLYRGDVVLRAGGAPIRSSGLMRPHPIVSRWEKREPLPTYITDRLPGDVIELEYVRQGQKGTVKLRLTCQKCGDACAFYNGRGAE